MRSIAIFIFSLASVWGSFCFAQSQPSRALATGTVRYQIVQPGVVDTGILTLHFRPGIAALVMVSQDSSGIQSIFDFEKDSTFNIIWKKGERELSGFAIKISELLEDSKKQGVFVSKNKRKRREILGYECTQFEARTVGSSEKIKLVGWVTPLIQTKVRPIMDETLMGLGFPLEMKMTLPKTAPYKTIVFRAVAIDPFVDATVFDLPKQN